MVCQFCCLKRRPAMSRSEAGVSCALFVFSSLLFALGLPMVAWDTGQRWAYSEAAGARSIFFSSFCAGWFCNFVCGSKVGWWWFVDLRLSKLVRSCSLLFMPADFVICLWIWNTDRWWFVDLRSSKLVWSSFLLFKLADYDFLCGFEADWRWWCYR